MRRSLVSSAGTVALVVAFSAALIPLRSELSIATVGLIMVVPVVVGVATGGYPAGLVGVTAGFLAWDYAFIPPYYTLNVGAGENWVALAVYAVVMLLVAQVFSRLQSARQEAQARASEAQRLFELSQLLVEDRSLPELLRSIVDTVQSVFSVEGAALLLPDGGHLEVAAAVGDAPDVDELGPLHGEPGRPMTVGPVTAAPASVHTVALAAAGRPVGVLALRGGPTARSEYVLLRTFANHAALAVERAQLRAEALRARLLEELDALRQAVLGAVSHDLRTPLGAMKVASSTLVRSGPDLPEAGSYRQELYELLDGEIDRLDRLVTGLLDLSRYQSGALQLRSERCSALDLAAGALAATRTSLGEREVLVAVPADLPDVVADPVLIGQVLVNLLDNAHRYAPAGTPIRIEAALVGGRVTMSVVDAGPGVPDGQREAVFDGYRTSGGGGRTGMGLWISRAFVEAHGGRIWVEEPVTGGARFSFTLDVAHQAVAG